MASDTKNAACAYQPDRFLGVVPKFTRNLLTLAVLVIVPTGPVVAFAIAALQHHGVSITTGDFFWDGSMVGFLVFVWFCVALTFPFNILAIWEGVDTDD